ncbi:MAG TPA: hypothetical protein VM537_17870, partial [Anaerolineae bacterium]|nr:hypothetical protein [Anaerolineae bacterium]
LVQSEGDLCLEGQSRPFQDDLGTQFVGHPASSSRELLVVAASAAQRWDTAERLKSPLQFVPPA